MHLNSSLAENSLYPLYWLHPCYYWLKQKTTEYHNFQKVRENGMVESAFQIRSNKVSDLLRRCRIWISRWCQIQFRDHFFRAPYESNLIANRKTNSPTIWFWRTTNPAALGLRWLPFNAVSCFIVRLNTSGTNCWHTTYALEADCWNEKNSS